MIYRIIPALMLAAGLAANALAASDPPPNKPVTETNPSAGDVATTPLTDLNVKKGEIPEVLLRAQRAPYAVAGSCRGIVRQIDDLDAVMGPDFDGERARSRKLKVGKVAQEVVGSFIPFRGLIRQVSGADAQQQRLNQAITAGYVRRAFLKGVGLQKSCGYPARPA